MSTDSHISDYRIVAKIRNNNILARIEGAGYGSVHRFCKAHHLNYQMITQFIAMSQPAKGIRGGWKQPAIDMAAVLGVLPEDLFNERQESADFATTTITREIEEDFLPLEAASQLSLPSPGEALEQRDAIEKMMGFIKTERARQIVESYFGLNGREQEQALDIAARLNLSAGRVHQIILHALRRMRERAYTLGVKASDFGA